ncbi:MAG: efflux RND transporter periplasmic adaptor subunit [Deltaproteobacteria bacterium]|nr:efflux RND transporter periplasmic adaptor subunit [Deltaproteobacteria bacterium]
MVATRKYLILLSLFFLLSCSGEKGPKSSPGAQPEKVIKVRTTPVITKTVERRVEAVGTLLPWDEVTVATEVPGTIANILLDMGDKVRVGDVLLRLDSREASIALLEAEASLLASIKTLEKTKAVLEEARTNLNRYKELYSEGVVSKSQMDSVETQYNVAVAQWKEAEARVEETRARAGIVKKRLGDYEVKSPISGEVGKRLVSKGETIREKTPLFVLVKRDVLKFQGAVPERFALDIKVGEGLLVFIDSLPGRPFPGRIERVSPGVDTQTRSLGFEAKVLNPEGRLRPGLFARGSILIRKDAGVPFVPEGAIYSFAGITKVFVILDGKAHERQVKTGIRMEGLIEIDGVRPGEVVAITNLAKLFDGAKVEY